jgi:bifunctional ADP-heptose synthase (sugar kinase/adenylyltransferase)
MKTIDAMTCERLGELVRGFAHARIAVVGDFFLDKYLEIDPALAERSIETGKIAHQVAAVRSSPGAAGTVVANLAALGAVSLFAVGFSGDDGEGYELRNGLRTLGCDTAHLHVAPERMTPTYLKPRDAGDPTLAGEHSRYDTKNRRPTPEAIQRKTIESLDALLAGVDAVIVSDQVEEADCGVVTARLRDALAQRAECCPHVIFWADSRRRIREFRRVIVKPNQFEAVGHETPGPDARVEPDELLAAMERLRAATGAPLCVTRGPAGMVVTDPEPTRVPGVRVEGPTDPTGAGDSATAGAVLALCSGATLPEAALVGNLVASITIEQLATTGTACPDQLAPRLELWRRQQSV